ncbi:probable chitinase 10 [Pecten maximus]|uniref:probable chitinase 10 n=1 Tax=Pecten maximus TaxID=6579 RepID=UPI0014580578|nr:probable chitinase 10 [Pecten maximus]
MLLISLLAFCVSVVLAEDHCRDVKGSRWLPDPNDCTSFYVCFHGMEFKYTCPTNTVTDVVSRACVPKGSRLDTCKKGQGAPDTGKEKPTVDQGKLNTDEVKPTVDQGKPDVDQGKPSSQQVRPDVDQGKPSSQQVRPDVDQGKPSLGGLTVIHAQTVCQSTPRDRLPHSNCAKYVDCHSGVPQVHECPYPQLYDTTTEQCQHHDHIQCQSRKEPKSPCDYDAYQCGMSSHCVPCEVRFPSCEGAEDGPNPWTGREWTPYFITCYKERLTFQSKCTLDASNAGSYVFDPIKKQCVDAKKLDVTRL